MAHFTILPFDLFDSLGAQHSYLNHSRATAQNLFIVQIKLHTHQSIQNIIRNIKTNLVGIKD